MIEICVEYWLHGRGAWTVNEIKISPSPVPRPSLEKCVFASGFFFFHFIAFHVFDSPFGSSSVCCVPVHDVYVRFLLVSQISPHMCFILFIIVYTPFYCWRINMKFILPFNHSSSHLPSTRLYSNFEYIRIKWVYWWQAWIFYSRRREINCSEEILFGDLNSRRCQTSVLSSWA